MTLHPRVHIAIAGWSNPPARRAERQAMQSHLSYYASQFSSVEINSSFYRPHQAVTYTRWRDETPARFRFSVKMPRSITHESGLKHCATEVASFYQQIAHLQPKLSVVLVQLPPSLEFDGRTMRAFFKKLPVLDGVRVVCEPRHASWFSVGAHRALHDGRVSRVGADPARNAGAQLPAVAENLAYFRWHGAPQLYYSSYSDDRLAGFAQNVASSNAAQCWCVFDNTARHAAWGDAMRFKCMLHARAGVRKRSSRAKSVD
jgi:uncharacterized protein YecE (DUF72 family)